MRPLGANRSLRPHFSVNPDVVRQSPFNITSQEPLEGPVALFGDWRNFALCDSAPLDSLLYALSSERAARVELSFPRLLGAALDVQAMLMGSPSGHLGGREEHGSD